MHWLVEQQIKTNPFEFWNIVKLYIILSFTMFQNEFVFFRSLWTNTQSLELRSAYLFLEILFYISYFLLKRSAFSLKLDLGDFPTIANIRINTSQSFRVDWKAYKVFMLLRAVIKWHWADRRDIHIECSKQFKWNLYIYVSGQSRPFWAALKLL